MSVLEPAANYRMTKLGVYAQVWAPYRCKHLCGLLYCGNLRPAPFLEELHTGGIVQCGGWVCAEKGGETLAVGKGWRAGAIGQLKKKKMEILLKTGRLRHPSFLS